MFGERCWKEASALRRGFFKYNFSHPVQCFRSDNSHRSIREKSLWFYHFRSVQTILDWVKRRNSLPAGFALKEDNFYRQTAEWVWGQLQSAKVWPIQPGIYSLQRRREANWREGSKPVDRQVAPRKAKIARLRSWLTLQKKMFTMNRVVSENSSERNLPNVKRRFDVKTIWIVCAIRIITCN